jgi:hypothetical protein
LQIVEEPTAHGDSVKQMCGLSHEYTAPFQARQCSAGAMQEGEVNGVEIDEVVP